MNFACHSCSYPWSAVEIKISAVTFDTGLCMCRVPVALFSHTDSSSLWLTCCFESTSLLTNTSALTTSHQQLLTLHARQCSRWINARTRVLSRPEMENEHTANAMLSLWLISQVVQLINGDRYGFSTRLQPKSKRTKILFRRQKIPSTERSQGGAKPNAWHGFVHWWCSKGLTPLPGWCDTSSPGRQSFCGIEFLCH